MFRPVILSLLILLAASGAQAEYPERPIRVISPFAAGGGADLQARLMAAAMAAQLGQPVVVENRTGAGGNIGTALVAAAEADGYTLLATTPATAINETLYARPGYSIARDFRGVSPWATSPMTFVVNPRLPVTTLRELVDYIRAHPGEVTYASGGSGLITHVGQELLKYQERLDMVHVPYRGQGPAITDLIAGQVQMSLDSPISSLGFIRGGQLRSLAITSRERSAILPEVPTVVEAGFPDLVATVWYGLAAPARTPPSIIARVNAAVASAQALPTTREALARSGAEASVSGSAEYDRFMHSEVVRWGKVIRAAAIRVE
ncbi:tripartite tricarboxylate transporter substrate binding protein [Muricoccus aerilatus]|uniref:tripartite tricarboxylate transporter substrate binding protein n=1 Tax=Muricoccus aerilatus TaxID=452982 RepID=UPI0005C1BDA3|nr:tripartite tricarboxylate transporter substrate binding protein [Roseomonas aerilata]